MPVELRKRKAVEPAPAPPAKKKNPVAKVAAKVKEAVTGSLAAKTNGSTTSKVAVGQNINLEGFGGEVETNDGVKTSLKKLVDESKAGVVLFTYPKASTPGCKSTIGNSAVLGLIVFRHYTSMSFPGLVYSIDGNGLFNLRTFS
jgi:thioredoxin-dependent peroxiredoxin